MAECQGLDVSREADEHTLATWLKMWYELYAKPNIRLNHFYPFGVWVKMWGKHLTYTKNQNLQQKILKAEVFEDFWSCYPDLNWESHSHQAILDIF